MATRFCTQCGQPVEGDVRFCTNCGAPVPPAPQPEPQYQQNYSPQPEPQPVTQQPVGIKPSNYLVWAILATIFCCLPFGIVGIVFAAKVNDLWNSGQYQASLEASRKAKTWTLIAIGVGILSAVLYFVLAGKGLIALGNYLDNY